MSARIALAWIAILPAASSWALDYEKDIMPIFVKKCGECHSDEQGKAKGGLRFDNPEHFFKRYDKNGVVVPGDWDASYLFVTLFRPPDHEDAMPPQDEGGERLSPGEVRLVQQWIADGATILGRTGARGEMPKEGEPGYIEVVDAEPDKPQQGPGERDWTNTEGKTIRATLIRVEGNVALLRVKNGTVYRYPVEKLSQKSRAQLGKGN